MPHQIVLNALIADFGTRGLAIIKQSCSSINISNLQKRLREQPKQGEN